MTSPRIEPIPEGTRIGKMVVGERVPGTKHKDSQYACKCDCGTRFYRRTYDVWRAFERGLNASCGRGRCQIELANAYKSRRHMLMTKPVQGQGLRPVALPTDRKREKQPLCKVCFNLPWQRLPSSFNEVAGTQKRQAIVGPDLRCKGCGGKYAAEEPETREAMHSSAGLWQDAG